MKKLLCILSLLFGISACQAPDQLASIYGDPDLRTQLASRHRPDSSKDPIIEAEKGMGDIFRQEINLTSPEGSNAGAEQQNLSIVHAIGAGGNFKEDIGRIFNLIINQHFYEAGHVAALGPGATGPAVQRGRPSSPQGVNPQTDVELKFSGKHPTSRRRSSGRRPGKRRGTDVTLEFMGKNQRAVQSNKRGATAMTFAISGLTAQLEKPEAKKPEAKKPEAKKPGVDQAQAGATYMELKISGLTRDVEAEAPEEAPEEASAEAEKQDAPLTTEDIPKAKQSLDFIFYLRTRSATRPAITGDPKNPHDMCLYHFGSIAKEYDFLEHFNHLNWQASFSFYSDNADLLPLAVNNRVDASDLASVNSLLPGRKEWERERILKRQGVDPNPGWWERDYDYVLSYNEYKSRLRERIFQFTLHPIYLKNAPSFRSTNPVSVSHLNTKEEVKDPLLGLDGILTSKPHGAIRDNSHVVVLVFGTEFLYNDQHNYSDEDWEVFSDKHDNVSVIFVNPLVFEEDAYGGKLSDAVSLRKIKPGDVVNIDARRSLVNLCNWDQHPTKASMLGLVEAIKGKF